MEHIVHPIPPLYDENCRVLILGSFPSVKSREAMFFYGHPQNRFWPLMARLFGTPVPGTIGEKKALMLSHHIALWDTIFRCDIQGSSDASIRNAVPTDLVPILAAAPIGRIFCNGSTSFRLFEKYQRPLLGREASLLPSTSPANAKFRPDDLAAAWAVVREAAEDGR